MKLRKRLRRITDNLKFRHKIIFISSFVSILICFVSIIGYQFSARKYDELLYDQTAYSLRFFAESLSADMQTVADVSTMIALNPEIQSYLNTLQSSEDELTQISARYAATQSLYQFLIPDIISVTILLDNTHAIVTGLDSSMESVQTIQLLKEVSDTRSGAESWIKTDRGDGSLLCVRAIRKINEPYFLRRLGYLVIRIDYERMVQKAQPAQIPSFNRMLTIQDDRGNHLYPPEALEVDLTPKENGNQLYYIQEHGNDRLFVTHTTLDHMVPSLEISSAISYNEAFDSVIAARNITIIVMLLILALALIIAPLAVRNINARFQLLIWKMDRLKSGNFELLKVRKISSNDELGLLNRHFDEMTLEFKKMIEDNYVKQLLITQAQLKNLEQQINPHFLYNTLESINWFAKRQGEPNIPIVVEALGNLLRSSLSEHQNVVPLKRELAVLESYITIQKMRHGDMLSFQYEIADDVLNTPIPKMSLQPLVENAVAYSMEECLDGGCTVTVAARQFGEDVIVSVFNNGSEVEEDLLEKLKTKSAHTNGHGIALVNIDARLKLIFGHTYGLTIRNDMDGVLVELLLPGASNTTELGGQ